MLVSNSKVEQIQRDLSLSLIEKCNTTNVVNNCTVVAIKEQFSQVNFLPDEDDEINSIKKNEISSVIIDLNKEDQEKEFEKSNNFTADIKSSSSSQKLVNFNNIANNASGFLNKIKSNLSSSQILKDKKCEEEFVDGGIFAKQINESTSSDALGYLKMYKKEAKVNLNSIGLDNLWRLRVFIDGPYGTPSYHIFDSEHAVLIGAGIGITPFASILQSIMNKYRRSR